VESPSLEIFQPRLDAVLCSLLWVTLLGQGVGLGDPQRSCQPLLFCDSVIPRECAGRGSPGSCAGRGSPGSCIGRGSPGSVRAGGAGHPTLGHSPQPNLARAAHRGLNTKPALQPETVSGNRDLFLYKNTGESRPP